MDGYVFEARDVRYVYPGNVVGVEALSLTIAPGERVAIVGANGSGKSTLLKLLDGLYFPTSGELLAFGEPITEEALADEDFAYAFRRRVGLVFQDSDVQLFSPTVWDEVAFGPLHLGLPKEQVVERVETALRLLKAEKLADRTPHRLSGGEKKKVALASVLAIEPEVLLLDEPTANLDPRTQGSLIQFLMEINARGKTIITATHNLDVLEEIADRVFVLDEGHRLVAQGPPSQILGDRELLLRSNLIHEHPHYHQDRLHVHSHLHPKLHDHEH